MNIDAGVVKHPRRLVVNFGTDVGDIIRTNDDDDRPQLIHEQNRIEKPSRLVQFATRLGLTKGDKPMMDAVEKAYAFVSDNYQPGDQVTLLVDSYYGRCVDAFVMVSKHLDRIGDKPSRLVQFATRLGLTKGDKPTSALNNTLAVLTGNYQPGDQVTLLVDSYDGRCLDAAEMVAKHLHDGIRPGDLSRVQSKNEGDVPLGRIPIHCVAVWGSGAKSSVSEGNDKLKSRFPAGIEHIIYWSFRDEFSQSCATRYDADGSMISREICISREDDYFKLRQHCTKHILYYKECSIPQRDNHEPVWTHRLDSPPSDVQGGLSLEATKPPGMYVHELQKYQGLPRIKGDGSMLVWKSYRSAGEHT